jgi:hypothetical protein
MGEAIVRSEDGGNGKGTALAVVQRSAVSTYEPRDIGEGITLAGQLAKSCLLGRNLDTPEKVFAVVVAGRELGLPAMTALRSIHLVEGKPVMAADTMVGLVRGSGLCEYFRMVESTDEIATYEAKRRDTGDVTRLSFSWDDAKRAGLASKDVWVKYRPTMLRHRCAAMVARELFGDVMLNVYEQNEEDEIRGSAPRVYDVTPTPAAPARIVPSGATSTPRVAPTATVVQPAPNPAHIDPTPTIAPQTRTVESESGKVKVNIPPAPAGTMRFPAAPDAPPKSVEEPRCGHYQLHVPKIGKKTFIECTPEELGSFIGWQEAMRDKGEWKPEYAEKNARSLEIARAWRAYREAQAAQTTAQDANEPPVEDAPPGGATQEELGGENVHF